MNLILVTALIAICGADKLDRTYLPPASAATAGGSPGFLQTPFKSFNQGLGGLPKGGYSNEFEGVVVDAAAPGTRASGADETGLGGPRIAYGSTDSKVGEAAFTADTAFPRVGINSAPNVHAAFSGVNHYHQSSASRPERIQAPRDRVSNTVKYENEVSPNGFNYAFETDNGIIAEEIGIEVDGVRAQGGYSYTGDDGKVYTVTYIADEDGYRPKGDHLPTPPPIPEEILKSLEKNAQDEAAGVVDDGSYDAQKYNTGNDYTNTDNGQYNSGQKNQIGIRPQTDAVASGSFISQNNQGFARPNAEQFGASSSLDSSKNVLSNGINFGVGSNLNNPTHYSQKNDFGDTQKNEYLSPSNAFNQNRRPASNGLQGTNTILPLSLQKLQEDRPKGPGNSSPIFGKPTIIDSTLSIKDPFAKRPSGNRFNQSKLPNQQPQAIGGSFEVVSGNVYSSKNEYLPPRRQIIKPTKNNVNQRFQGNSFTTPSNEQNTNSQIFSSDSPSASAFASISRPTLGFNSQKYSGQQIHQYTGQSSSNQVNQDLHSSNKDQPSLIPGLSNAPSFNRSPVSQFQYRPGTFGSQSPTLKPQSELTIPLESNFNQNKNTAPTPIVDGPDSPSFISSSKLPSFGSQPSKGLSGQYNFDSYKIQQVSPTKTSASAISTLSDQLTFPTSQSSFGSLKPGGNLSPQSQSSNNSPVSGQYTFSTPMPSFSQINQQQGSDDSYYYNTPSNPFNTPTPRPQGSIFPNKASQTPLGIRPQSSDGLQTFYTPQSNTPALTTNFPKPSTLGPISPTRPTPQDEQKDKTFQSQFNKVTQASSSSFPSPTPTTSVEFNKNQFGQFNTRPSQSVNQFNKESQGFIQQIPSQSQQQYNGQIYEYNKPPQTLPSPQNDASTGQIGQQSQFGSNFTPDIFGQRPQSFEASQVNQADNSPAQSQVKPNQIGSQPSKQNSQPIQGASKFPPTYNEQPIPCCKQAGFPSQNSQANEQDGTAQLGNQFKPNQDLGQKGSDRGTQPVQSVSSFAGVGESFGGPRKPPSFDATGYHY